MMPQSFPKLLGHSHRSQQLQVMAMSDPEKNHQNSRMQIVPMLGRHFFFFLMVGTNRSSLHKTAQLNLRDAKHPPQPGSREAAVPGIILIIRWRKSWKKTARRGKQAIFPLQSVGLCGFFHSGYRNIPGIGWFPRNSMYHVCLLTPSTPLDMCKAVWSS